MRRAVAVARMLVIALTLCSVVRAADKQDSDNWRMYGRNLQHTFSNAQSPITPENVATLHEPWAFPTGDVVSASPAVVHGVLYTGSWDGYFYALNYGPIPRRLWDGVGSVRAPFRPGSAGILVFVTRLGSPAISF